MIKNTERSKKVKMNIIKKIILGAGIGALISVIMMYIALSIYYNNHFYSNTRVNGVNASNMTVQEVEDAINSKVKTYAITLKGRNGISDLIYGKNIDLHTEYDVDIEDTLANQNGFAWPGSLFQENSLKIKTMLKYDEELLKKQIDEMSFFDKSNMIDPVNAYISEYGENGYEIVPEAQGSKVDKAILFEAAKKSIIMLAPTLSLEEVDCYKTPEIDSKNPKLVMALTKLNKIAGAKITYQFGEVTEILDGNKISKWLTVDDKYRVTFNPQGIKEYVDYIGRTYNSFGRVRTFQTSYGKVINVKGGDYGWWMNRGAEVKELTDLVQKGKQQNRVPVYFQTAKQYGKDDIGDTYVEINLTAQHMFYYKDGKRMLETDIVTGNLSKKLGTPVGTYPIQYKERDSILNGEDYATPVKYWMPFNHNIGLHDASWRNKFGKDYYMKSGSHGCINMPPAKAKKLFANIEKGTPVIVYKLKGTETFKKDEKDTKKDIKSKSKKNN